MFPKENLFLNTKRNNSGKNSKCSISGEKLSSKYKDTIFNNQELIIHSFPELVSFLLHKSKSKKKMFYLKKKSNTFIAHDFCDHLEV